MTGRIYLEKNLFTEKERILAESGAIKIFSFRYGSGVCALRIQNRRGHVILLPYQGQQVWDAVFDGRRLTMANYFDQPVDSPNLLDSYGAFLYHCGALRMGSPGPEDRHPLHGELPGARYDEAWLTIGQDEDGIHAGLSGTCAYTKAFGDKYRSIPSIKLYEDGTVLDVGIRIENLSHSPMDLMYMCHVNFLPADGGEIVQATGWGKDDMIVRSSIPAHVRPTPEFLAFLKSLSADPSVTRVIRAQDTYSPEIVFYLRNLRKDSAGLTHMIQRHPDGSSDYVGYDPEKLDHAVRWIFKDEDLKVMGMVLPSTCDPEGYTAEKKKGNVRSIPPLGKVEFSVKAGYLDAVETKRMESAIRAL